MTATTRISTLPAADEAATAEASVAQAGQTRRYSLKSAASRAAGGAAEEVPILGSNGALSTADGGTGLAVASPGANKLFGTDAAGNPALRDLPGGTLSIADGAVTTPKLANGAVTTPKIGSEQVGAEQIKNLAVGTTKLAGDAVTAEKLAANAVGTAQLGSHVVTTGKIANEAVTHAALAADAVRLENIDYTGSAPTSGQVLQAGANGTLTFGNKGDATLADGSVTRAKIAADAVNGAKIADDAVGLEHLNATGAAANRHLALNADADELIFVDPPSGGGGGGVPADGSITEPKLADDAVSARTIANGAVANAAIASNANIDLAKLAISGTPTAGQVIKRTSTGYAWADDSTAIADGSITTAKLAAEAVTAAKIDDGAVTTAKIGNDAVTLPKIKVSGTAAAGKVLKVNSAADGLEYADDSTAIADRAITAAKLADDAVISRTIGDDQVTADHLANNAVVTAAINNGAVTAAKIASGVIPSIPTELPPTDDSVTAAKIADDAVGLAALNAGNQAAGRHLAIDSAGTGLTFTDPPSGGGTPADGSITEPKLAANNTPTDDQVLAWDATNSQLYWKDDATTQAGSIGDGTITIAKLAAGPALTGQIMVATSSSTLDFVNPANPGVSVPSWGAPAEPAQVSSLAANGTSVVNADGIVGAVNNTFNNATATLTGSNISDLLVPNFGASGSTTLLPAGQSLFYAGIFGRSGGTNYVYLVYAGPTDGYSLWQRVGSTWTQISTANSNTSLLYADPEALPADSRWYPMAQAALPSGETAALGRNTGSAIQVITVIYAADLSTFGVRYYGRESGPLGFAVADAAVTTAKLASQAVTTAKIGNAQITASKIALNAVGTTAIASGAVTDDELAASAVTLPKISASGQAAGRYLRVNSANNGLEYGTLPASTPAANSITTAMLQNGAVTANKIASGVLPVIPATLPPTDGSVTAVKLADDAVITRTIADGAVDANRLASNAVTTAKIQNGAITGAKIGNSQVGTNALGTGVVTAAKLAAGAVTTAKVGNGQITLGKISTTGAKTGQVITMTSNGLAFAASDGAAATNAAIPDDSTIATLWSGDSRTISLPASLNSGQSFANYDQVRFYRKMKSGTGTSSIIVIPATPWVSTGYPRGVGLPADEQQITWAQRSSNDNYGYATMQSDTTFNWHSNTGFGYELIAIIGRNFES